MLQRFYAIVTQRDCSEAQAERYKMEPHGPILHECYLNEITANEDAVRARAESFRATYGWAHVVEITVDIPGD
jgi:hypothetical protein